MSTIVRSIPMPARGLAAFWTAPVLLFAAPRAGAQSAASVTLPNSLVVNSPIQNFSRLADERGARLGVSVTIGYDASWRPVHAMLEAAALKTPAHRAGPGALRDAALASRFLCGISADRRARRSGAAGVQIMPPHFQTQPDEPVFVPKENWFTRPAAKS
jgi:hypothetical protein